MTTAIIFAELLIKFMPMITVGTTHLFNFIAGVRTAAMAIGEWSADTEAAYQARLLAKASSPEAQPDEPQAPV